MTLFAALLSLVVLPPTEAERVLVVWNELRPEGRVVAQYYAAKRNIPDDNVLMVRTAPSDDVETALYKRQILERVRERIKKLRDIDYIVLVKGVPLRLDDKHGNSVDSMLAAMELGAASPLSNPFFMQHQGFSFRTTKMYLVTRLDGYSVADATALVDRSLAAKPVDGPFLLDAHTSRASGYGEMNLAIGRAATALDARRVKVSYDATDAFLTPKDPLAGYVSWGSNDSQFDLGGYRALRFKPGALAETFVSTSARTFNRVSGGQSLIADLIAGGVTGAKGYVAEPTTMALARPDILFDRYLSGFNLAESFYMASPVIRWKDVVIGDPLCRPYRRL